MNKKHEKNIPGRSKNMKKHPGAKKKHEKNTPGRKKYMKNKKYWPNLGNGRNLVACGVAPGVPGRPR